MPGGGSYCARSTASGAVPPRGTPPASVAPSRVAHRRAARCSSSPPTTMQVRDATVGPLSGTSAVSALVRPRPRRTARRARRRRSARAWCACPGRSRCWPTRHRARRSAVSSSAASRGQLDLAAAGEARSRGRRATGRCRGSVPRHGPPLARGSAVRAHRLAQHRQRRWRRAPSRCPVAVMSPGRSALRSRSAHRVEAERLGDAVHVHLDGEQRLRRAEAAERAVRRRVGHRRAAADAHVVAAVGPGRVDDAARQHHRRQRARRRRRPSGRRCPSP